MTDKEIRTEVERLRKVNEISGGKEYAQYELDVKCGYDMALDDILSFINSLPEEPIRENRKEAILKKAHELANRAELISDKFPKSTLIAVAIDMAEWCDSHSTKEPVSEELEKAAKQYAFQTHAIPMAQNIAMDALKAGAQWKKQQTAKIVKQYVDKGVQNHNDSVEAAKEDEIGLLMHSQKDINLVMMTVPSDLELK